MTACHAYFSQYFHKPRLQQRGAALLTAMITLVLIATLAAGAAWQQWQGVEVERNERARLQAGWLLVGALDWARLILREDARSGGADHLGEPWAVPLQESRLSSFLAADQNNNALLSEQDDANVFLSGQIQDVQARLNVYNLIEAGRISPIALAQFAKLFDLLNLNPAELQNLAENLRFASDISPDNRSSAQAALLPQRLDQLSLLGLSPLSLQRLSPFIVWLPSRTPVNINTASAEVLYASVPGIELADAQKLMTERSRQHFKSLADVSPLLPELAGQFNEGQHSVASRFFEITGRLRLADGAYQTVVVERSVVQRDGLDVKALWRERGSFPITPGGLRADQLPQNSGASPR
ncbi:MAG: type II secretion system minor pseudopilin GspK [Brachymonas sp.]|nr:type II secretion system minor pseudopilin GspK [Brachymonas sp.]NJS37374.1 type II secretion system minor pseudopilin GspK [Brachymonas sp.]